MNLVFNDSGELESTINLALNKLQMPKRSTKGSAAYDFYSPFDFDLTPGYTITIPTGIRAHMDSSTVLMLFPKSSMGVKHDIQLKNTVGIIDSDYFFAKNEGHIILSFKNTHKRSIFPWLNKKHTWHVKTGDRICQGIFVNYGITVDDNTSGVRTGGYGSTGR